MIEDDSTAVNTIALSLPSDWREVPIDPAELVSVVEAGAAERMPGSQYESLEFRRQLVLIRRLAEQAHQSGVVFMAVFSSDAMAGEADGPDEDEPYFLSVICFVVTRSATEMDVNRVEFRHLRTAVESERSAGAERVENPVVLELRGGPTVRDVVVRSNRFPDVDGEVQVFEARYYQLMGEGEGMAVLGFVTPNVELAPDFTELFDSIADSLEFVSA